MPAKGKRKSTKSIDIVPITLLSEEALPPCYGEWSEVCLEKLCGKPFKACQKVSSLNTSSN